VYEEKLDLADVQSAGQPLLRGEAAQAVKRVGAPVRVREARIGQTSGSSSAEVWWWQRPALAPAEDGCGRGAVDRRAQDVERLQRLLEDRHLPLLAALPVDRHAPAHEVSGVSVQRQHLGPAQAAGGHFK